MVPPLALRCLRLVELWEPPALADLRGVLVDAAVALAALILVVLLARPLGSRLRPVGMAAGSGLWAALHIANYEAVRTLGGMVNLSHAAYVGDLTFLMGTLQGLSHPVLFVGIAISAAALASAGCGPGVRIATLCVAMGLAGHLMPLRDRLPRWRQDNPVAASLWATLGSRPSAASEAVEGPPGLLAADLAGDAIIPSRAIGASTSRPNVLLVILEGMSDLYLEGLESPGGRIELPGLRGISESFMRYTNFIAQQRQTNRGEYALLCGDLPRLSTSTPEMTEIAAQAPIGIPCLPDVLHQAGYRTVYLQAAILRFMDKDRFMPLAGFREVHGREWFTRSYAMSRWGIDDRAFFEQAASFIAELRQVGGPWFATLLTVGTHHPFVVPEDFASHKPKGSLARAAEYLDGAAVEFLGRMETLGVLEDTLVIISSDESAGTFSSRDNIEELAAQAQGLLLVHMPSGDRGTVRDPYLQMDMALSVADFLGLAEESPFLGRSFFRRYRAPRHLVFGNTHLRMVGGVDEHGIHACDESLSSCVRYAIATRDHILYGTSPEAGEAEPPPAFLRRLVPASHPIPHLRRRTGTFRLTGSAPWTLPPLRRDEPFHLAFGGQHLSVPAHARIDVDIVVELRGDGAEASFLNGLKNQRRGETVMHFTHGLSLSEGQKGVLRYSFATEDPMEHVECFFAIANVKGENPTVRFIEATLRIVPLERVRTAGLQIREITP